MHVHIHVAQVGDYSIKYMHVYYLYRLSKRITPSDQFDLDLNSNLFVIYARRTTESNSLMAIETHSGAGTRDFPGIQVNPSIDVSGTVLY